MPKREAGRVPCRQRWVDNASPLRRSLGPGLSRVVRRLGLVAAALFVMCAAASQAQAQELVSNAAQGYAGRVAGGLALDLAQGFTTGSDSAGYTLSAIALRFANASAGRLRRRSPCTPARPPARPWPPCRGRARWARAWRRSVRPRARRSAPPRPTSCGSKAAGRVQLALTRGREDAGACLGLAHPRHSVTTDSPIPPGASTAPMRCTP